VPTITSAGGKPGKELFEGGIAIGARFGKSRASDLDVKVLSVGQTQRGGKIDGKSTICLLGMERQDGEQNSRGEGDA